MDPTIKAAVIGGAFLMTSTALIIYDTNKNVAIVCFALTVIGVTLFFNYAKKNEKGKPSNDLPPAPFSPLHQLPPVEEHFIGRKQELDEILKQIQSGGVHISGIRGTGGIGKTALAKVLAHRIKVNYPDAQIVLDLKGATEDGQKPLKPTEVMAHVLRSFQPDIHLPADDNGIEGLYHSILNEKKVLLFLDNAKDREQVEPLLPPPGCFLLVTSRK